MIQKRIFVFVTVLVIFGFTMFAEDTEIPLVTEVQLIKGDSTYRNIYYYNEKGMRTLEVNYVRKHDNWTRRTLTEWLYENDNYKEQHRRIWRNNDWSPSHLIKYEYENGHRVSETHFDTQSNIEIPIIKFEWKFDDDLLSYEKKSAWLNNVWSVYSQVEYIYNANLQLEEIYINELEQNTPIQEKKLRFTYDVSQRLDSIITYLKVDTRWEELSMVTTYYKPQSNLKDSEVSKKWDKQYSKWVNEQNIEYSYDAQGRLIDETYQYWHSMFWKNDLSYKYEYDKNNLPTKQTTYLPVYNDLRPAWSISYSDFKYNKASLIEAKNEFWGGETDSFYNTFIPFQFNNEIAVERGSQIRINYLPIDTSVPTIYTSSKNGYVRVYPNPSSSVFYFDIEAYNVSKWIITDLSGKTILINEEKQRSGVIDLGDMKPGIYLFQAFTDEGVKMQKLIKE